VPWFALNVYYNRVFQIRDYLSAQVDETYVPTVCVATEDADGRRRVSERPAVPRLMFARTEAANALALEATSPVPFRFYRAPDRTLSVIPDTEMQMFILVSSAGATGLEYFDSISPALTEGQRVRVTAGPFAGIEGTVRRVRGNRRVVVALQGLCAVATPYIPAALLTPLP